MHISRLLVTFTCSFSLHLANARLQEVLVAPFAAKDPSEVPPPLNRTEPATVHFDLVSTEIITEIEPGKKAWVWTYNNTVPGPMLRVVRDDTVEVTLKNAPESFEPHNIDLHAVMGPGGGATVTYAAPGAEKTFSFKALREGAYIYHCSAKGMPWEHVAYGMYGLILVEPPGGLREVDREFYIGQSDWYHSWLGKGAKVGDDEEVGQDIDDQDEDNGDQEVDIDGQDAQGEDVQSQDTNDEESEIASEARQAPTAHSSDMHPAYRDDIYVVDENAAMDEHPTMYSFNGHKHALTDPTIFGETIRSHQDETVRFFVVNGGPNVGSNFHIIGTIFDVVYSARFRERQRYEETVYIPPGSATTIELKTPVPGQFLIVDHALFRVSKGAAGYLHVNQTSEEWPHHLYSPNPADL